MFGPNFSQPTEVTEYLPVGPAARVHIRTQHLRPNFQHPIYVWKIKQTISTNTACENLPRRIRSRGCAISAIKFPSPCSAKHCCFSFGARFPSFPPPTHLLNSTLSQMFGLIRRISHSVIPRPDRPWEDDRTYPPPFTA